MRKSSFLKKIFLYSLFIMLFIIIIAHITIWIVVPKVCIVDGGNIMSENVGVVAELDTSDMLMKSLSEGLVYSFLGCTIVIFAVSYFGARMIVKPIKEMVAITKRMANLEAGISCSVYTNDEFEQLSNNINQLYEKLFFTIEQLREQLESTAKNEKFKIDFLYAASHELKTPLTACNAMLENMILKIGKYKDYSKYLPECKMMIEELNLMVQNILETTRLNGEGKNIIKEKIKVADFLSEIIVPYEMIAKAKKIHFSVNISSNDEIVTDKNLLRKAISNIIMNAVLYTETGKSVELNYTQYMLEIVNEGEIIEGENLKKIFEPFFRMESSHSREHGGSGLGLYIVHTILTILDIPYDFRKSHTNELQMKFVIYFRNKIK